MYELQTFDAILTRMLERVPGLVDKREGSVIYDACAPAAAELAQMYIELDIQNNLSFADTASGEYLSRKTAEFGVNRAKAVVAERRGLFFNQDQAPMDIPLGSRFSIEDLTYSAKEKLAAGEYRMFCESPGKQGNRWFGALLPIDNIPQLGRAELAEVLIAGDDEESDESLRERFYETVNEPSFGGNIADYKKKLNAVDGVGAVKVYPAWNGGGTVRCAIIGSNWEQPSSTLVNEVQQFIDPVEESGQGLGQAPIGHQVTVEGVESVQVHLTADLTLADGFTIGMVKGEVEAAVAAYLLELRKDWANQQQLVVRTAQIDARILTVAGVEDISGTSINGAASNMQLEQDQIPVLGTVELNE